ncbi:MAG TPA: glycosyltransferase family 2 protein [Thermoanaerobaculia bacterium]|nr:glycosyltransferase family 2 protein [Thermoanaerobaculia bacterium]
MISLVVVSYRSGPAAIEAIRTFRDAASEEAEVVVVVNSGDEDEAALLRASADRVILAERNLGYAGGLNRGAGAAAGDLLLLSNPDLVFRAGSVAPLAASAREGFIAAGPAFFLDEAETLHLPPFEEPSLRALTRRVLACDPSKADALFGRDARRSVRNVLAMERDEIVPATALSGGLVAVTRETLRRVGPFDEGFPLYFEENDWQRRLRVLGGRLRRVGASRVIHSFGQSTRTEPRASEWFARSERRFYTLHFGRAGAEALDLALAAEEKETRAELPSLEKGVFHVDSPVTGRVAVAASPNRSFRPHALALLPEGSREWHGASGRIAGWHARAFDAKTGRILLEGTLPTS